MKRLLLAALLLITQPALAAVVQVTDSDITAAEPAKQHVHWTADNEYVLNGFVFVDSLCTLTIDAGTVIKGKPGTGENASALIVARGGKIFANGTPTHPIIFTAEADDVNDPNDLPFETRGLWGGVIILGRSRLNSTPGPNGGTPIEGIPTTEKRATFGGNDDDDNSGVFRYVSIRYPGTQLSSNNEINGLGLGAVGRGTVIEYVEVFCSADDGFEFWGGTVNLRYLVSMFNDDEAFDYDESYRGKGQFWFALQSSTVGNHFGEHDGGTTPVDGQPYATPNIFNVTYLGSGRTSTNNKQVSGFLFRDNAGGHYTNSIFGDYGYSTNGKAVTVEDLASGEDSRRRWETGDLTLRNNIWFDFSAGTTWDAIVDQAFVRDSLVAWSNTIINPQLRSISRNPSVAQLDPRPAPASPAYTLPRATPPADGFFENVPYIGAFGSRNWASGWTFIAQSGFLDENSPLGVKENSQSQRPIGLTLNQNRPNPFNPSTKITFSVPVSGEVRLSIYNALGQHVVTLVDGYHTAGVYSVVWNAAGMASGLYIGRLEAGSTVATRKMMLAR